MKRTPLVRKTELRGFAKLKARKPMRRSRPKMTPDRKAANGAPCVANVANVCNYRTDTTVLAHLRFLGDCGAGLKPPDTQGIEACSACHDWIDKPSPRQVREAGGQVAYERDRNYYAARGLARMRQLDRSRAQ